MFHLKYKSLLYAILIFSIFCLSFAYFVEYVLGHKPCNLCLFERLPYILAIIIISLVLITKKFEKLIFILLTLIFISSTILSFYHLGIEQGFFEESFVCLASPDQSKLSSDELLKQLENMPVSCKNVDFKIFGLSLATINLIVSFILSIISIKKFLNYENR